MVGTHGAAQMAEIPDTEVGVVDTRPQISPYMSPTITFYFGDGPPLRIHEAFVKKAPKLYALRNSSDNSTSLKDIPGNCGHVLVHYLSTDRYQSLKPYAKIPGDRHIIEFETSVRVYSIAMAFEILDLGILCQSEIERLGHNLHAEQALKIINNVYPTLTASDIWLQNYLKSLVKELMDSPPSALLSMLSEQPSQAPSIDRFLLKATIELYHERVDTLPTSCAPPSVLSTGDQEAQDRQETTTTDVIAKPNHITQLMFKGSPTEPSSPDAIRDTTEGEVGKEKGEKSNSQSTDETTLSTYEFNMAVPTSPMALGLQNKDQKPGAEGKLLFENLSISSQSNPSTPLPPALCPTIDASGGQPNKNPSAPIGFEVQGFSFQDVAHIPLMTRTYVPYDEYDFIAGTKSRFHHICRLKTFERFSPEELRLRHEAPGWK
ncbi:hypothetical protein F4775DRAFT_595163 [Biscogniauxia sp. FL1348]|nr:hypothetical protein F4775DRAFT_595163 [Biscogniauxia sp. FL1348]